MRFVRAGTDFTPSTVMADLAPLDPLKATLAALIGWLRDENTRYMVIGGVAASLLGRPRMTRDVDVLVWIEDDALWPGFLASGRAHGFVPRVADAIGFASVSRVLLVRHVSGSIDVDISLGGIPFEDEALARAGTGKLGDIEVPLPTPEDLVIMKAVAHRPRDTADIEGVLDAHPTLDREHIRQWVGEFADGLDTPELLIDVEKLLKRGEAKSPIRKGPKPRRR